ncbi:Hypothetical predicted protein [Mytilus galloprovincialis]|uniref:protein-tyrosine-phosphatase n=1 Tax=Mytilus galloprovincialis TaxID=29158 RepID=A0A8B6CQ32_MYTGA|nr:Hypothetical predicted protein [Mytilus galloprovincialis]
MNTSTIPPDSDACYEDGTGLPDITQTIPCNQLGKYVIYYDDKGSKASNGRVDGPIVELCYVAINDNVASDGLVYLHPIANGNPPASIANDGNYTSCSKTNGVNVTVQVDLMKIGIGKGMHLTLGEPIRKEGHHVVYASNNSNTWNIGTILYNERSLPPEIKFNAIFRYLTYVFYPDQGQPSEIELCEIGISGCPPTHFGPFCNKTCPNNCHGPCDLGNGLCTYGCSNGWTGVECKQACQPGYHGKNCQKNCSTNCIKSPCNHVTGGCNGGCTDGWEGFNCFEKCPYGQFGRNCSQFCEGCLLSKCDPVNGLCDNTSTCSPGYIHSAYCNIVCDDGYFGSNCSRLCNCATGNCSVFTGNCPGGCANGWRGEACDHVKSALKSEESSQAGAIGGSFAAVIIVVIVVVAFIVYKRRFLLTKDTKKETNTGNNYANVNAAVVFDAQGVNVSLTDKRQNGLQKEEYIDGNVYNNVPSEHNIFKYKILIEDLKEAISEKQKDEGFKKEYEVLPKGLVCAHVAGSKAENKVKNRFLTTWPYDHSRVILKGDTKHDYINASYIDNYNQEKAYIASQGPKQVTMRDFWHMIWQENVGKIVMVTQLEENKKKKCEMYWPEIVNTPMVVSNYIVTMKEEREHTVYVYRLLTVSNKNIKNEKEREIHHFHFTEWPDHGVPDSIKVVNFYRNVMSKTCNQLGPIIVHCSAGIGRTGTFIAIDALYENGKKVGYINVMEYIQMMRKDRMNMVQTYVSTI